jgi:glucokinase
MRTHVLGIDLGGTKVSAGVLDHNGQIVGRARAKTRAWRENDEVFSTIAQVGHTALERAGIDSQSLDALGIGSPGPLDPDTGYIIDSANLRFDNFPLGPRLATEFGCPVVLANDVDAGTYGEFRAGAARGASDVLGVFVGTGIGGGIIANGKLYHGFSKNAGEIGHIVIRAGGPKCNCGARGCLEALASRTAISKDIRKAIRRGRRTIVTKLLSKKAESVPSTTIKKAFQKGDPVVTKIVTRAAEHIGIALGSMVNLLGPEIIVLGGGVIEALYPDMIGVIEKSTRTVAFEFAMKGVQIVKCELGDDAGIIGAAMLATELKPSSQPA